MAYIDKELFKQDIKLRYCNNCARPNEIKCRACHIDDMLGEIEDAPTADVVEVKHATWHIMSENPLDETDAPREAGWYRIITADGEEMTDYFFGKPTMTASGVAYWRKCKKIIRAWAKIDVPDTNDGEKGETYEKSKM